MQEFIDKLIGRLEEESELCHKDWQRFDDESSFGAMNAYMNSVSIAKELAEQHKMECVKIVSEVDKEKLDSLHKKILKNNKMLEIVTEEEINALIQVKQHNNGWIPCSERLPEEHDSIFAKVKGTDKWNDAMFEKISDDVNVTIEFEDGTRTTKTLHTVDGRWHIGQSITKFNVIAWQPLPPTYKEGGV